MHHLLTPRWLRVAPLLALLAAAAGCGRTSPAPRPTGSARIAVTGSALTAGIARIVATITRGDGPDFPAIVAPLSRNGNDWAGFVTGIPAGSGRRFDVAAYDAAGAVVLAGSARADIAPGGVATVVVFLSAPGGGTENRAPVIEYLTASATLVKPLESVRLSVRATDPDPGDAVTYRWQATCGTFDAPAAADVTWTAPDGAGFCQLSITASDPRNAAVTAYLVVEVNTLGGDAQIVVGFNTSPVVAGVVGDLHYREGGLEGDLSVTATDPDGDPLSYAWSSDCTGLTFDTSPPYGPSTPHLATSDGSRTCVVSVTVTDGPTRGGRTVGVIVVGPDPERNVAPRIGVTVQPFVDLSDPLRPSVVGPNAAVTLTAYAQDPEGEGVAFLWTATAGVLEGQIDEPGRSLVVFRTPDPLVPGLRVTVRATDPKGANDEHVFYFKPDPGADPCAGQPDGATCDDGNACTTGEACGAGTCGGGTARVCTASDQCHAAGTCDPATGACSSPPAVDGTPCADGQACTTTDVCAAGVCFGAAVTCAASDGCHVAGICDPATGACTDPPAPDGTTCSDGDLCTTGELCASGACAGGAPVACAAADACHAAGTCDPASGLCSSPNAPDGTSCSDASLCTTADACTGGTCGGAPVSCPAGQSCNPSTGACEGDLCAGVVCSEGTCDPATGACPAATGVPRPQVAKRLEANFKGLAMGRDGSTFVSAKLFQPTKSFDGVDVTSNGAGDLLVARYGPDGALQWVRNFGDAADQDGSGIAVTQDGTVAAVGFFTGTLAPSSLSTPSPTPVDYLLLLDAATGVQKAGGAGAGGSVFDDGIQGRLSTVATNPNLNVIAVCGYASVAATQLVPGATYGGGTEDIVVALFSSSGARLWSRQLGAGQEERCTALHVDDAGDVYAAGQFDGALDLGLGALPNPSSSVRRHVWVAKLSGATGATLQGTSFGNVAAAGNHNPRALARDATGDLFVAGFFTNTLPVGGTSLVSAGAADAFVARLGPTLAPVWAVRMGASGADELRGLALDSSGHLLVAGLVNTPLGTPTTGFAPLQAASTTASDAFLVMLDANGVLVPGGAAVYGDGNSQAASAVVVNRAGTGAVKDLVGLGGAFTGAIDFGAPTTPFSTNGTQTDAYLVNARFQP